MPKGTRGDAAPWFVLSTTFAAVLIAVVAFCASSTVTAQSVTPSPRGQPESLIQVPTTLSEGAEGLAETTIQAVDWDYWLATNPNIVAWVTVPGTAIDHPIVQATADDPTYYLTHDVYGNWNRYGCAYVDAGCDGLQGISTVVFGHNMGLSTNSMFADFAKFSDEAFARSHPLIIVQTPQETIWLRVSAAEIVEGTEQAKRTNFADIDEMRAWFAERFAQADVKLENDEEAERIITFVTCSYTTYDNERTLVYAQPA